MSGPDLFSVPVVCFDPAVRLSALAEWQQVDRSTMTTQVRRLEELDLVGSSLVSRLR